MIYGLAALVGPFFINYVQAADLPAKAPRPAPASAASPASAWSGCYVGGQLGGAWSTAHWQYKNLNPYNSTDVTGPLLIPEESFDQLKLVVGAQAGCNYNFSGPWVAGVEASVFGNGMNRSRANGWEILPGFPTTITTEVRQVGSATARLGYAFGSDWLWYAKGGYALTKIYTQGQVSPTFNTAVLDWSDAKVHQGFTVGAGFEYRLFRNVTVGAEYNYYQFSSVDHTGAVSGGDITAANQVEHRVKADVQTVMARLNFYTDSPVAAQLAADQSRFAGAFSAFTSTEARYTGWQGTRGANVFSPEAGKGYQFYSPTSIGIDYEMANAAKVETRIRSGYVYSRQGTVDQGAIYQGPIDTQMSLNTTVLSFDSIRPTFGVAFNFPTGTSYLPGNQRFARMDPDLVEIGSYGEGFNVNPTAGFIIGINKDTSMSVSGGYAWRGVFVREAIDLSAGGGLGSFNIKQRVNPGDVFTANANVTTSIGKLVVLGSFAYMSESTLTIDGAASSRAGARYVANVATSYPFDEKWALDLNGSWSFQEKNEIPDVFGALVPEPRNSNSTVLIGSVDPSYQATERLRLAANYSVLWRDHNYYDPIVEQFVPAKLKNSVGGSAKYALSPTASVEARGAYSWIHQDIGPMLPTSITPPAFESLPPSLNYTSWLASVTANFRF